MRRNLSRHDAITLLELINSSLSCSDEEELKTLINVLSTLVPFDYSVCGCAKQGEEGMEPYRIVNTSYPVEWLQVYVERKYNQIDPIFQENFDRYGIQDWTHTYNRRRPPPSFLNIATDFGLVRGYSFGLRDIHRTHGSMFSFSGSSFETNRRHEVILKVAVPHLNEALLRVVGKSMRNRIQLSAREKEVLNWVRQGKSNWDISVILGISERTVKFHVMNIMHKLDVVSRAHAAAVAVQYGLIDIE